MAADRQRGFSLLEVLVAFAVLAAVLAVALPLLSQGLSAAGRVETRTTALMLAESRLAELAAAPFPGESAGTAAGGYAWRARVSPLGQPSESLDRRPPLQTMLIEVEVGRQGEAAAGSVRLVTVRALAGDRL